MDRALAWPDGRRPGGDRPLKLIEAQVKLSAYRRALHERIDDGTVQLVGHDQRDPAQLAEIVPH